MSPASGKTVLFLRTDPGVMDSRIQKESASLRGAGYEVHVFGWDRQREFPEQEELGGISYRRSRLPAPYGSKLLAAVLPLFWLQAMFEIARLRPDAVHACDLDAFVPGLLMKPLLRFFLVYDIFDHFAEKMTNIPGSLRRMIAAADLFVMRFADVVIVTDENRKRLIHRAKIRSTAIIMNVPPRHDAPLSHPSRGSLRLCLAGAIHEHRGLRQIAEAVRGLDGVQTVFAGWVPRKKDLEYLHSQPQISYLGKLSYPDALALLGSCDAMLALYDPALPINAMASSNKVFEAMSVRRAVITNSETSIAAVVEDENCGLLVPYHDVAALRSAVVRLRDDVELRARLGRNGYAAFERQYNWGVMERRLLEVYAALPANSRQSTITQEHESGRS